MSCATDIDVLIAGRVVRTLDGSRVDVALVDELARVRLLARRRGAIASLRGAPPELYDLAEFLGLRDAIGLEPRR